MQTLRKKNSPCKFKNEPTRFLGEGVSFKAKLIGILEVSEARGDRMCQAALADLKMAIRAAGEHKQRIAVQVSIDGLRLRDEKTGECLYHHPVHKISFISQDMSDSRAFGYIFGSPDTGHRFFGIKTDKAASQVVIAIRELFQVVFELKKKEIELAKQHIEQNAINTIKFHTSGIFVEPAPDTKGAAGTESSLHRMRTNTTEAEKPADRKPDSQSGVIADLLDLQFELNSLQQGMHQMDKINPENPPSIDDLFESDPFGDSFANMKLKETVQPILPPPPSSSKRGHLERQQTVPAAQSSATSSPATTIASKTPPPQSSVHWFDKETENLFSEDELANLPKTTSPKKEREETQAKSPQIDVFTELDPLGTGLIKPYVDKKDFFQHLKNPPKKVLKDLVSTTSTDTFPTNFHIVPDPLEAMKPTSELIPKEVDRFEDANFANFDKFDENESIQSFLAHSESPQTEPVTKSGHHQPFSVSLPPEEPINPKSTTVATVPTSSGDVSVLSRMDKEFTESMHALVKLPSLKKYLQSTRKKEQDMESVGKAQSTDKPFPVDFSATSESPASPLRSCSSDANSRLSSSSAELDLVPEPPPRGAGNILINPPPLPPKKQGARGAMKPPPRPPHTEGHFHYDFPERERGSPSPTRSRDRKKSPLRDTQSQFDDNFSPPVSTAGQSRMDLIRSMTTSAFEDSFSSMIPTTNLSSFFTTAMTMTTTTTTTTQADTKTPKPSLGLMLFTLSQLTSSNLDELASSLGMTVQELTSLTLQQLTECLATLSARESGAGDAEGTVPPKQEQVITKPQLPAREPGPSGESTHFVSSEPLFKTNFDQEPKQDTTYDKYAVFRELLEMEQMELKEQKEEEVKDEDTTEEEPTMEEDKELEDLEITLEAHTESASDSIASLVNLTVKLPPSSEDLIKEEPTVKAEESDDTFTSVTIEADQPIEVEEREKSPVPEIEIPAEASTEQLAEAEPEGQSLEKVQSVTEAEETAETSEKDRDVSESPEKIPVESNVEETNGSLALEKAEVKSSTSTSSDRYAALREIIGDPEQITKKAEEEAPSSARSSPVVQPPVQSKSLADEELLSLFSDTMPLPGSPKKQTKKDEDLKSVAMDIFEEIKMLNTGTHSSKESKPPTSGFEDVFCPFAETREERDDTKDDTNWAKFDTRIFGSERSYEGPRSVGGTSPWSPDGKEFHRDPSYKGSMHRHSGDSDNEWKDEEESEESNGRVRGDGRFWSARHPRYEAPGFDERSFYEEAPGAPGEKRDRSFRGRMGRKSRGAPWTKNTTHRPRDPSPWQGCPDSQWEDEPRRYPQRKIPYKEEDNQYEAHWKCRPKPQCRNWGYDYGGFYEDERFLQDRFGSQESMGYEADDRWSRGKYERRRWEEDARYWSRRGGPPDPDYPMRETYYYYRESREWPHDYPSGWDEEYGPERPGDDSPRYNPAARKISWPKRPNSANEGRNTDIYAEPRGKFGTSRSECSDNDSDPYLRPSQRSRSRESYWGSDQEYDSWAERPYWSEGPDPKSESLYRKRVGRYKSRQPQSKTQSPFEDDFAQSIEHVESPAAETLAPVEPRIRPDMSEQKREVPPPSSPSSSTRCPKEHPRRDIPREYQKRSSFFEDDLTPTASASSDASDRQRLSAELKATPEELPCSSKEPHQSMAGFPAEDGSRDSFFNGDLRYDDDAFAFKSELEDNVPDHRATTLPLKNSRQSKYAAGGNSNNNNNSKGRGDQFIRKSESVNIFLRESDPFDDDDFFN